MGFGCNLFVNKDEREAENDDPGRSSLLRNIIRVLTPYLESVSY